MMNGFDPTAPRFLADLDRIQERSTRAERQISSGLRVETASDDPESILEILRVRTRIQANEQVQTNMARVQSQVNAAEKAVRDSVNLMERARVLGAQNSGSNAPSRTEMAVEARQIHERLLALVSTSSEGRYVFAPDGVQTLPYVADSTQPNGVRRIGTATVNSTMVADENQVQFSVSRSATELFDAPGAINAFQALEDLANGLANDSETDVSAATVNIVAVLDHLNRQLTFYGSAQNRVKGVLDAASKNAVALKSDLSRLQDADLPAAILELNTAKLHHETALAAHSKAPKSSLFDYLG